MIALTVGAYAQSVAGTISIHKFPTKETAKELADQQLFQLERMGFDQATIARNAGPVQTAAEREAAGLEATGPFEYCRDGNDTFVRTVATTTIEGLSRSVVTERYVGGETILTHDGDASVFAGDRRSYANSGYWDVVLLGTVPPGYETTSVSGDVTVYRRTIGDLVHSLEVKRRSDGTVESVTAGYVTPEQYRKPGEPALAGAIVATRNQQGTEVTVQSAGHRCHIVLDGPPSDTEAQDWPMPDLGANVVDTRLGPGRAKNYTFDGKLASVAGPQAGIPGHPTMLWLGGGLALMGVGAFLSRRK